MKVRVCVCVGGGGCGEGGGGLHGKKLAFLQQKERCQQCQLLMPLLGAARHCEGKKCTQHKHSWPLRLRDTFPQT